MTNVLAMSTEQKIGEAIKLSIPMLLPEARRQVEAMLTTTSVKIIAAGLAAWAVSHLFGVGEIMDVILLGFGAIAIGAGAGTGCSEMVEFVKTAMSARSEGDLKISAQHLARAIDILGITFVSFLFLRQSAKPVIARGIPRFNPMPKVGPPPPAGFKPLIRFTAEQVIDSQGRVANASCSIYGEITIWLRNTADSQRHLLLHELGHRMFAPKMAILREFRATVSMSGYLRSAWLQFLEEAIVEARASFIEKGLGDALLSLQFPIKAGYVTITQLFEESLAFGNIVVGGMKYGVYMNEINYSPMPENVSRAN